ncbi:MAG: branched-chain amino acid aminotransferase [Gammaproteobacteria bacterium]|nr:branched-chain amino acid aminotransferase [Gammaproteobacteria bacterium]MCP4979655.1 branched-chain amino acid aminotransferase [Gammaproteobacteria bacterium]
MNNHALCWINQTIKPAAEASISVFDHGLLYGDGVFEGLRYYFGKTFMLEAHLERLWSSAQAIGLELPYSRQEITAAIEQLIEQYHSDSGYLRLVVTRGQGSLGIDPGKCANPSLFIIADELSVMNVTDLSQGVSLHVSRTRRSPAECLDPKIKSMNYLNNILARIEANQAGMDEALMLNLDGYVCEGSVDNLFIVSDGVLKTPSLDCGLLEGITRAVVIDIAIGLGIPCEETRLVVADLERAEECFLSGTGAELIPVRQIGAHVFDRPRTSLVPLIMHTFKEKIAEHCTKR